MRLAHGNHEPRIGKQPPQVTDPGEIVIALGQVAPRSAHGEQLVDVRGVKICKCRVVASGVDDLINRGIVPSRKEVHPEHFLEGFRAVRRDRETVAMGTLDGRLRRQR